MRLEVRNRSEKALLQISHVYLFAENSSQAQPLVLNLGTLMNAEPFTADVTDAPDALTAQFRIPIEISPLPAHAIEDAWLAFRLTAQQCDSTFRLRLHTAHSYFDYPFRVSLSRVTQPRHTIP
jgi:hypothetical protein